MVELSERILRGVLDIVREGIIVVDRAGRLLMINREAQKIWGYTAAELIGQRLHSLFVADDRYHEALKNNGARQDGPPLQLNRRVELQGRRKNGEAFPSEAMARWIEPADGQLIAIIVRDLATRRSTERYLAVEHAVNRLLVTNPSTETIAPQILEVIGEHFGWELGAFWSIDPMRQQLRCTHIWCADSVRSSELNDRIGEIALSSGEGLPGLVWLDSRPIWSTGGPMQPALPHYKLAEQAGLQAAVAIPVRGSNELLGVIEFHSRNIHHLSNDLVETVTMLGNQIGLFLERRRAEDALQRYVDRLEQLRNLDRAILTVQSPVAMAQTVLQRLQHLIPYRQAIATLLNVAESEAHVLRIDKNGVMSSIRETMILRRANRPAHRESQIGEGSYIYFAPDEAADRQQLEHRDSDISMPLHYEGRLIGFLTLAADVPGAFTAEHRNIARDVAARLEFTLQHASLLQQVRDNHKRLQSLSRQLLQAQERERQRISRELHDQIGQSLTAVKMNLQAAERLHPGSTLESLVDDSSRIIDDLLEQVRDLSLDLRPLVLDDLGLVNAMRWYTERVARRSGLQMHFSVGPLPPSLPSDIETTCFRVTQEALTNVVRYAHARSVWVELRQRAEGLHVLIRDDGVGFDVGAAQKRAARGLSLGLLGMQERVKLVGGQITIISAPAQGTIVQVGLPFSASDIPLTYNERKAR